MTKENLSYFNNSFAPAFGVVEDVIDESYVRVRWYGIHPLDKNDVATEDLPPALVLYPTVGGQVGGGSISHNIEIDSWVMGFFLDYPYCMQPIVTNTIQGTSYSMSTYKAAGGEFVGDGSLDSSDTPNVNTGATINLTGGSNVEKTHNYVYEKLVAEGSSTDPHMHASAVTGVLMLEASPKINPAIVGGYKGRAWGICQWLGSRRSQLFARYGKTKDLGQQLDFMWWELGNTERKAKSAWLRATNLPDAVAGFCLFERAEEYQNGRINRKHKNYKIRLTYAYQVLNSVKYKSSSSSNVASEGGIGSA